MKPHHAPLEYFFVRSSSTGDYVLFIILPNPLLEEGMTFDLTVSPEHCLCIHSQDSHLFQSAPLPYDLLHFLQNQKCSCVFLNSQQTPLFTVTLSPELFTASSS